MSVRSLSEAGSWREAVALADRSTPGGASDELLMAAVEAICQEEAGKGDRAGLGGAGSRAEELCSDSLKLCLRIKSQEQRATTALKHLRESLVVALHWGRKYSANGGLHVFRQ